MAISKIILNGVTQMDLTGDTVDADKILSPYTAHKADGTQITGSSTAIVPTGSLNISANGTFDVANYASAVVNVQSGGSEKNVQVASGYKSRTANSYGSTELTLTVAKTGTYKVSWVAWRGSSSGTMGTNLHVNNTTGTNQQTFTGTYGQCITLENQSYNKDDVLTLYATSGNNSRTIYVANLTIEEQLE